MSLIDATELAVINELFGGTAFAADATLYAALFTTVPADDGSGGVEANYTGYARVSVTNNTTNFPSANPKLNANAINFAQATGPQTGKIKALGWFTASSAGTLRAIARLCDKLTPWAVGLATGDLIWAPGHTLVAGEKAIVWAPAGATLPTGLTQDTEYYVINVSGDSLQLSLTSGGSAIDITANGAMSIARSRFDDVNIGTTPTFAASAFSFLVD